MHELAQFDEVSDMHCLFVLLPRCTLLLLLFCDLLRPLLVDGRSVASLSPKPESCAVFISIYFIEQTVH